MKRYKHSAEHGDIPIVLLRHIFAQDREGKAERKARKEFENMYAKLPESEYEKDIKTLLDMGFISQD